MSPSSRSRLHQPFGLRDRAVIRLAALPVVLAGKGLVGESPVEPDLFAPILLLATLYAGASLAISVLPKAPALPGRLYPAADLAFLCALTYYAGGASSPVRYGFLLVPLVAACLATPPATAAWAALSIAAYLGIAFLHPSTSGREDVQFVATQGLVLGWFAIVGVLLSVALTRRDGELLRLAKERGRLVARVGSAEDRERKRLAEALHDGPLQTIVAVRQDILDAERGELQRLSGVREALEQTVLELRAATFELHPHLLDYAGLGPALQAVAREQAERGGYEVVVDVAPLPSRQHDALLFSLGRELLTNACKHAQARHVSLSINWDETHVALEVADDGVGCEPEQMRIAAKLGHIGLPAGRERVAAIGGVLEIESDEITGTRVTAKLPQRREDDLAVAGPSPIQATGIVRSDRREPLIAREPG